MNQDGRVSATTSVQSNGSVRLLARDTVDVIQGTGSQPPTLNTTRAGVGDASAPAASRRSGLDAATADKTAVADQAQPLSSVEVVGRQVDDAVGQHDPRAGRLRVHHGAAESERAARPATRRCAEDTGSRIRLAAGSLIDVAGSEAEVDLARNVVAVELRTNELRDSPVQRDGALRGETVFVDSRVGTPVADVSGRDGRRPPGRA